MQEVGLTQTRGPEALDLTPSPHHQNKNKHKQQELFFIFMISNQYLLDLINEAQNRGGGMILNLDGQPAVVVLTLDRYNRIMNDEVRIKNGNKGKVLVTGGAGYIGAHLVKELLDEGYEVAVLDNLSCGKFENIDKRAQFFEGDLADMNFLNDIFASNKFEAVFHMAASVEVEESVREPQKYFDNNVGNTVKLLEAMAANECKKIIYSSTAAVYGESEKPITENSPLKPASPYGSSKLLGERAIKYFCDNLGFSAVVFRYFNACGFRPEAKILPTHESHLIYNVIQVAKGQKTSLEVFGNTYNTFDGTGIRDYVHVLDIVKPHILALGKLQTGKLEIYNIGTGKGSSVSQIINTASEVLNRIIPMQISPKRDGDSAITVADNSKLKNELGYQLQYSDLENILSTSWTGMKDF